jgi:hypothetical protein
MTLAMANLMGEADKARFRPASAAALSRFRDVASFHSLLYKTRFALRGVVVLNTCQNVEHVNDWLRLWATRLQDGQTS